MEATQLHSAIEDNSTRSDSLSPIEKLPVELVWMIIDYTPASIFVLRQTSRILKCRVDEHTLNQATKEVVEELKIEETSEPSNSQFLISMQVSNSSEPKMSALILILRQPQFYSKCRRRRRVYSTNYEMRTASTVPTALDEYSKMMAGIHIERMHISISTLTEEAAKSLHRTINDHKVEKLVLIIEKVTAPNPVNILLELSAMVQTIRIHQLLNPEIDTNTDYFFGVHNVDFAPIIVDMFSRGRMDKLTISNDNYRGYLRNTEFIIENLHTIRKQILLCASCNVQGVKDGNVYITTKYEYMKKDLNYMVEVYAFEMLVKHLSRKSECCRL